MGLVLSACGTAPTQETTARATAGSVTVSIKLMPPSAGRRELLVTFRPLRPGFHLYSVSLPTGGVDGMGIPTRIAIRGNLMAVGRPTTNQPIHLLHVTGIPAAIPVYPDGPVTFTLPVRQTGAGHQAEVVVSYAACSNSQCLMPVADEAIRIDLS